MAKYLDSTGVSTLWTKIKEADQSIIDSKASALKIDGNFIQLLDKEGGKVINQIDASVFITDGMLEDVEIIPAKNITGGIEYTDGKKYGLDEATAETKFLHFTWNTVAKDANGKQKEDFIKLEDIAPSYKGDNTSIEITDNNTIEFKSAAAEKINVKGMTIGGTHFGDKLKEQLGTNVVNDMTVQEILELLLSSDDYTAVSVTGPEVKTSMYAPTIKFYTDSTCSTAASGSYEPGQLLYVKATCGSASATLNTSWDGFTNGYATSLGGQKIGSSNPPSKSESLTKIASDEYTMNFTLSSLSYDENDFSEVSNTTASSCAITGKQVRCECGKTSNTSTPKITANTVGPHFNITVSDDYPRYYNISTLGKTNDKTVGEHYTEKISVKGKTYSTDPKPGKPTSSNHATVTIKRKMFFGYVKDTESYTNITEYLDSAYIRDAQYSNWYDAKKSTENYSLSVKENEKAKVFFIAVPYGKTLSICYSSAIGESMGNRTGDFKSTTVNVNGLNSSNPGQYTVYYYVPASPQSTKDGDATLIFKIA